MSTTLDDIVARCDAWDESEHPREGDGKFSESSGSGGATAPTSKRLSANEKSALSSYSGDDFLKVNRELRAGRTSDPMVGSIDKAMQKSSLSRTTVYRGMSKEAARQLFPDGEIRKGAVVSDKAFLSTSKSYGTASARGLGGVILKIEVAEGAKGIDMKEHARDKSEEEVLLPRDAKLNVTGIRHENKPGAPVIVTVAYGD